MSLWFMSFGKEKDIWILYDFLVIDENVGVNIWNWIIIINYDNINE